MLLVPLLMYLSNCGAKFQPMLGLYIDNISARQKYIGFKTILNSKALEFSTLKTKDLLIRFVVLVAATHNKYTTRESPKPYYYLRVYNVLLKVFLSLQIFVPIIQQIMCSTQCPQVCYPPRSLASKAHQVSDFGFRLQGCDKQVKLLTAFASCESCNKMTWVKLHFT